MQEAATAPDLPILYRDATLLTLIYRVDPARAKACIPFMAIEPWVVAGKALAMLCMFEYRDTSIGPYNEIGFGILARRTGSTPSWIHALRDMRPVKDAALYVTNLPVTTESARAAGVDLWGYPKYVTGIETQFGPNGSRVVLQNEFELNIGAQKNVGSAGIPIVTFSVKDDELIRTVIDVDHRQRWGGSSTAHVRFLGDGPTAKTMRALKLDAEDSKPFLTFRADKMKSVLPLGEVVGPAS